MSSVDLRQEGPIVRARERERDDHVPSSSLSVVEPDNELEEGTGDSRVFLSRGDVCACVGTPGIIYATVDVV